MMIEPEIYGMVLSAKIACGGCTAANMLNMPKICRRTAT